MTPLEPTRYRRLRRHLALDPARTDVRLALADACEHGGDWARAAAHLRLAIAGESRAVAARLRLARACARAGPPPPLADLRRAAAIAPLDPRATTRIAMALDAASCPGDAAAMARQTVAADPTWQSGWRVLATALIRLGRFSEAADANARAVTCDPRSVDDHLNLGLARLRARRAVAAASAYRHAVALVPDHGGGLRGLRDALFVQGRLGAAMRAARAATEPGEESRLLPMSLTSAAVAGSTGALEYRSLSPAGRVRVSLRRRSLDYTVPGRFAARVDGALTLAPGYPVATPSGALVVDRVAPYLRDDLRRLASVLCRDAGDRMLVRLPEDPLHIGGDAVLLGGDGSFSHWMTDWLSKLMALAAIGPGGNGGTLPVIVSERMPPAAGELLARLGIDRGRWRPVPEDRPLSFDRLWVPSLAHRYGRMAPGYARWLRGALAVPQRPAVPGRRVLLIRGDAGPVSGLAGIETVDPDRLDLDAWCRLGAGAGLVVGETGDALTASLMMPAGAAIVELAAVTQRAAFRPNTAFSADAQRLQAALLGQHHRRLTLRAAVTPAAVEAIAGRLVAVVAEAGGRLGSAPETRVEELSAA